MREVRVIGTGKYIPERVVKNAEIEQLVDTDDSWIVTRTGIRERRVSTGENTSQLACKAGEEALKNAGIKPEELDLIIVATTSPEYYTPSTACIVQGLLGAKNAVAFDVGAACSGFVYSMITATNFLKAGSHNTALIIGAEVLSKILNWEDRNTCILFGDGAGAAVLRVGEEAGVISYHMGSDGSKGIEMLSCYTGPVKNAFTEENQEKHYPYLTMNGKEVFKFAVRVMAECIEKVLEKSGLTLDDVDHIVPHGANERIIESVVKRLHIEKSKVFYNLEKYGNTSGASIPIALSDLYETGSVKKGDKIILVGFGSGLTFGAVLYQA